MIFLCFIHNSYPSSARDALVKNRTITMKGRVFIFQRVFINRAAESAVKDLETFVQPARVCVDSMVLRESQEGKGEINCTPGTMQLQFAQMTSLPLPGRSADGSTRQQWFLRGNKGMSLRLLILSFSGFVPVSAHTFLGNNSKNTNDGRFLLHSFDISFF